MKHRLMSGLLAALMAATAAFGLAACGGGGEPGGGTSGTGGSGGSGGGGGELPHTHTFASTWTSDEEFHWHDATCEHTNEVSGRAAHDYENGVCGTCNHAHENHNFANGACTVCGAPQPMADRLAYEPAEGGGYTVTGIGEAQGTEIIIPATHEGEAVVAIGDEAFMGEEIESVVIPASVKSIGQCAFQNSSLKSVTLAEGLETLGYCSFSKCNSLTEFTVPASVETWGTYVFWACENLQKVTFADGLKRVGENAFYQCSQLEKIVVEGTDITIANRAFFRCASLSDITFGPQIQVEPDAEYKNVYESFYGIAPNVEIHFRGTVEQWCELEDNVFDSGLMGNTEKYKIRSLKFDNSVSRTLYFGDKKFEGDFTIPKDVERVPQYAFLNTKSLTSLTIPKELRCIGEAAFRLASAIDTLPIRYEGTMNEFCSMEQAWLFGCSNWTEYTIGGVKLTGVLAIPEGITALPAGAFFSIKGITSVSIPHSMNAMGLYCLTALDITEVNYSGTLLEWNSIQGSSSAINYCGVSDGKTTTDFGDPAVVYYIRTTTQDVKCIRDAFRNE